MSMDLNYAEGWRPEPGDSIIGEVIDVAAGSSQYGGQYPIVTVAPEDGGEPVAIHCFHAALKARMTEARPGIGERIGVKFLGKREHKTDSKLTVADYVVRVDRRSTTAVWDKLDTEPVPVAERPDVPVSLEDFQPAQQTTTDDDIPF